MISRNKISFSILVIIFISNNFLFGQKVLSDSSNLYCKYETSFLKDTLKETTRIYENTILLLGDNVSIFRSEVKQRSDSLREDIANRGFANQKNAPNILQELRTLARPKYTNEVYNKNGKVKIFSKIFNDYYMFEPTKKMKWNLSNETKIISTYTCRKAVGKYGDRYFTAWFTLDIPIPEGPYNFKGLPGLIIELYDENRNYHFVLKELKKVKLKIEPENHRVIATTYDKFIKKRIEFLENPSGIFASRVSPTMKANMSKAKNDEFDKRMRSENNYLD